MKVHSHLFLIASLLLFACRGNKYQDASKEITPYQQELMAEGWMMETPQEGDMPEEYGIVATKGILDNYFDIELGGGLDMAVKIINVEKNKVIRYVYVKAGSTTTVNELPPGKYYLKITYGNDWMTHGEGDYSDGKFTRGVIYEKSTDYFDFGNAGSLESISYSLRIRVEGKPRYESFSTSPITEEEFFSE